MVDYTTKKPTGDFAASTVQQDFRDPEKRYFASVFIDTECPIRTITELEDEYNRIDGVENAMMASPDSCYSIDKRGLLIECYVSPDCAEKFLEFLKGDDRVVGAYMMESDAYYILKQRDGFKFDPYATDDDGLRTFYECN